MEKLPKKLQKDMTDYIRFDLEEKMLSERLDKIKRDKSFILDKHLEQLKGNVYVLPLENEGIKRSFVFNVETTSKSSTPYKNLVERALTLLKETNPKLHEKFYKEVKDSKKQNTPVDKLKVTEF